ncbi:MAG: GNAT family N-acetyltransferase [Micrococcales bacterium]|nr:GNAT family N-acetyltransferase [Micrococcales bacterium]
MSEIRVRQLADDEWELYREVRLASLKESPDAFADTYEHEEGLGEEVWHDRMRRCRRFVAEDGKEIAGVVSLADSLRPVSQLDDPELDHDVDPDLDDAHHRGELSLDGVEEGEHVGEVFGLWVTAAHRGKGASRRLMRKAAKTAQDLEKTHLAYWVGSDNGRAVAFASGLGFLPTDSRRPMRKANDEDGEEEIAMVMPLHADRGFLFDVDD